MPISRSRATALVAVALLLAGAAGCRGAQTTATTSEAGMKTDVGVTKEACPQPVDATKGCIYLGTISDLTVGPFAPLAVPITKAQAAFWNRVNKAGGIGGYEVDVTKYVRDN
jgi:ABC-type branched-subunit amino acid transport system substrate-binding protein